MKLFGSAAGAEPLPEAALSALLGRALWPRLAVGLAALLGVALLAAAIGPVAIPADAVARIILSRLPGVGALAPITWKHKAPKRVPAASLPRRSPLNCSSLDASCHSGAL